MAVLTCVANQTTMIFAAAIFTGIPNVETKREEELAKR